MLKNKKLALVLFLATTTSGLYLQAESVSMELGVTSERLNLDETASVQFTGTLDQAIKLKNMILNAANAGADVIAGTYGTLRPWLIWFAGKAGKSENDVNELERYLIAEGLEQALGALTLYLTGAWLSWYLGIDLNSWTGWGLGAGAVGLITKAFQAMGLKESIPTNVQKGLQSRAAKLMPPTGTPPARPGTPAPDRPTGR